ncbi:hypothetical protein LTS17_005410 [Exophiala oligosperma]
MATSPVIIPSASLAERNPETFPDNGSSSTSRRGNLTWHTLFSASKTPTDSLTAGIATCPPGTGHLCPHRHEQAEIYYITQGRGVVVIDGVEREVQSGDTIYIPGNAEHGIRNSCATTTSEEGSGTDRVDDREELKWFYVFAVDKFEDVVYRFS